MSSPTPPLARLSVFELAYLLSGRSDASAVTARATLGIPQADDAVAAESAGYTSLLLRELVTTDQTSILPKSWVGMIGHTVATAHHWVALTTKDEVGEGFQLLVASERSSLVITPEASNIFAFAGLETSESLADLAMKIVRTYAEGRELANVLVRSVDPVAAEVSAIFLKRSRGAGWQLGVDPVFPGDDAWPAPDIVLSNATAEEAFDAVADVLALPAYDDR